MSNVVEGYEKELVDKELWKDSAEIVVFGRKLRLLDNFPPSEIIIEENNNDLFSNSNLKMKGIFSVTRRSQGDIDSENKKNSYYTFYWKNMNDSQKISQRIAKSYITKTIDFPETCIMGFACYYHSDANVDNFLLSDENHYQLLNNSFDKNSEQVSKLQQSITEYKDILSYKNAINDSVGDGYDNVFENELLDASEDIKQDLDGVISQIEKSLVENYFLYDGSKVQDMSVIDGLRYYAWSDWEHTDATEFEFNSEIFALLQKSIVDYFDIDENHYQLLNNSFDKNSEQVSKLQQSITEYKDILSYKNAINDSVGDGYDNVFENELLDASEDIKQDLDGVISQIEKSLVENYFLYDGSKVQDMSVIDGLRYYAWSDWEHTDATEFEFNSEIFALLQKSIVDYFDIDENMLPENLKDELNIYNLNWEGVKVERLKKQRESYDKNLSQQDFVLTN